MRSFCARSLGLLLGLAIAMGAPARAELAPDSSQSTLHEVVGSGSGGLDAVLKRHKVPPEIRDTAVRGFQLDPDFPAKLPKGTEFRLVYEELPRVLEEVDPRLVLRSIWVRADGKLFDIYRYGWRGITPVYMNQ